jgi:hypothetical protein
MSHVVAIKTELKDLEAVKLACEEMGLTFKENQKSIRWFGQWVNDYSAADAAYKLGIDTKDYGKCDHAISVPGSNYDVGLLHNAETGGYKIYFDFYGTNGKQIQKAIGVGGERLLQLYGVHKATIEAQKCGYLVTRSVVPNTQKIQLAVNGM